MRSEMESKRIRLAFEAFAQLSTKLMPASGYAELQTVLQSQLKYLFDFLEFDLLYIGHAQQLEMRIIKGVHEVDEVLRQAISTDTRERLSKSFPSQESYVQEGEERIKASFHFEKLGSHLLLSIHHQTDQTYGPHTVLRLFGEMFLQKCLQIELSEQLLDKNLLLSSLNDELQEKNEEIHSILQQQEETITARTEALRLQNETLQRIAYNQAHDVREPLTRILGYLNLLKMREELNNFDEINALQNVAGELDALLKNNIQLAEQYLRWQA